MRYDILVVISKHKNGHVMNDLYHLVVLGRHKHKHKVIIDVMNHLYPWVVSGRVRMPQDQPHFSPLSRFLLGRANMYLFTIYSSTYSLIYFFLWRANIYSFIYKFIVYF